MRIDLIQAFAVMLPSDRFAASSPLGGEPDIADGPVIRDTRYAARHDERPETLGIIGFPAFASGADDGNRTRVISLED